MTDPRHIYFNYRLDNFQKDGQNAPKPASAIINTGNIIDIQSDFKVAVDFFNIRGFLPVFICPIREGSTQGNALLTPYGVCLTSKTGVNYTAPVLFTPQASVNTYKIQPLAPSQNGGLQDISTSYYYVWSIKHFLNMVNAAYTVAWAALEAAEGPIHPTPPWFQYDSNTGLISLIVDISYATSATRAQIFMNSQLQQYFNNFNMYWNNNSDPNYKDWEFFITQYTGNQNAYVLPGNSFTLTVPPLAPTDPQYLIFTQEYQGVWKWNNIRSVIIKSSSISNRPEALPPVTNPIFTGNQIINANNPPTQNILAFFDIIVGGGGGNGATWRENLYYQPQVLKWMDLTANGPLNSMNVDIVMQLTDGKILPLLIPINEAIDIKFRFQRKDLDD